MIFLLRVFVTETRFAQKQKELQDQNASGWALVAEQLEQEAHGMPWDQLALPV